MSLASPLLRPTTGTLYYPLYNPSKECRLRLILLLGEVIRNSSQSNAMNYARRTCRTSRLHDFNAAGSVISRGTSYGIELRVGDLGF